MAVAYALGQFDGARIVVTSRPLFRRALGASGCRAHLEVAAKIEADLRIPYDKQRLRGEIFSTCEVLEERYLEDVVVFRVRATPGANWPPAPGPRIACSAAPMSRFPSRRATTGSGSPLVTLSST